MKLHDFLVPPRASSCPPRASSCPPRASSCPPRAVLAQGFVCCVTTHVFVLQEKQLFSIQSIKHTRNIIHKTFK